MKNIIDHSEGYKKGVASNHGDVAHWFPKFGKSMDTFRADVEAGLKAKPEEPKSEAGAKYIVQAGAFNKKENAEALAEKLKNAGFDSIIRINGDYDSDGKVTAADARSVLRESVGLEG